MKYLIDTQVLIWFQLDDSRLPSTIYDILNDGTHTIVVSQVSLFEIAIKQKIGKLPELNVGINVLIELIQKDDFLLLPLRDEHIVAYELIPLFADHKDPFDRLILATALSENLSVISSDENFLRYQSLITLISV